MKITDVKSIPVGMPLSEPLRWGVFEIKMRGAVIVQVETDEGITGLGEVGSSVERYGRVKPILEDVVKPVVVGQNPLNIGAIWQRLFAGLGARRNRGPEGDALSGIDIALWDILGKATGQPVFRLLGAYRTEIPAYWAPSLKPSEVVARECDGAISAGFKAIKLRAGLGLDEDVNIVREARRVVGDEAVLMLDPNMAYDFSTAVQMVGRFAECGLRWIEEPIMSMSVPQYIEQHARLSRAVSTPVSGGESLFTRFDFAEVFANHAFSVLQPDAANVGGITECHSIAKMAGAWNVPCVPHIACSSVAGIGLAANLHVICAIENALYVEYDAYESSIRDELFKEPIKAQRGIVMVPERPGLGLELDPVGLSRYRLD